MSSTDYHCCCCGRLQWCNYVIKSWTPSVCRVHASLYASVSVCVCVCVFVSVPFHISCLTKNLRQVKVEKRKKVHGMRYGCCFYYLCAVVSVCRARRPMSLVLNIIQAESNRKKKQQKLWASINRNYIDTSVLDIDWLKWLK